MNSRCEWTLLSRDASQGRDCGHNSAVIHISSSICCLDVTSCLIFVGWNGYQRSQELICVTINATHSRSLSLPSVISPVISLSHSHSFSLLYCVLHLIKYLYTILNFCLVRVQLAQATIPLQHSRLCTCYVRMYVLVRLCAWTHMCVCS